MRKFKAGYAPVLLRLVCVIAVASCTALLSARLHAAPATRKVFANYMVAFPTYGTEVADFSREIKQARDLGIDGFVLNVPAWSSAPLEYQARVTNIFEAA